MSRIITWIAPDNPSLWAYTEIARAISPQGPYTLVATIMAPALSWTDTGADNAMVYWYRARPMQASGIVGEWTDAVIAPVSAPTVQGAGVPTTEDPSSLANAVAEGLMSFLSDLTFYRRAPNHQPIPFKLARVSEEWAPPNEIKKFPTAVVAVPSQEVYAAHGLTPTVLENTYDSNSGTALVKYGEWDVEMIVTILASDKWERDAVMKGIEGALNPDLDREGILIPLMRNYGLKARFTFLRAKKLDTEENVWRGILMDELIIGVQCDYCKKVNLSQLSVIIGETIL